MLSAEQVREKLRRECEAAGSQAAWARQHGMSSVYVHDIIKGRRGLGPSVLRALSLKEVVGYLPEDGDDRMPVYAARERE